MEKETLALTENLMPQLLGHALAGRDVAVEFFQLLWAAEAMLGAEPYSRAVAGYEGTRKAAMAGASPSITIRGLRGMERGETPHTPSQVPSAIPHGGQTGHDARGDAGAA